MSDSIVRVAHVVGRMDRGGVETLLMNLYRKIDRDKIQFDFIKIRKRKVINKMNTIPKIIHYCWFGGNSLPPLALKCIENWKKHSPDYVIKEWNENNFDINYNTYVRQAYDAKKYAFVSDVVRLWALVNYGGIYMDTDCELIRPIDEFLTLEAVSGFEAKNRIQTALMGCREGHPLFRELLDDYEHRTFILSNGDYDMTTNVTVMTNTLFKYGLKLNNKLQTVAGFTLYPIDYFCPMQFVRGEFIITKNTYAVHYMAGSWVDKKDVGKKRTIRDLQVNIYNLFYIFKKKRLTGVVKKIRSFMS